jgi:hypothetical protein
VLWYATNLVWLHCRNQIKCKIIDICTVRHRHTNLHLQPAELIYLTVQRLFCWHPNYRLAKCRHSNFRHKKCRHWQTMTNLIISQTPEVGLSGGISTINCQVKISYLLFIFSTFWRSAIWMSAAKPCTVVTHLPSNDQRFPVYVDAWSQTYTSAARSPQTLRSAPTIKTERNALQIKSSCKTVLLQARQSSILKINGIVFFNELATR